MKILLFASALALSTAAIAQDATPPAGSATTAPDATNSAPSPQGASTPTNPATPTTTPAGSGSSMPSTDSTQAPAAPDASSTAPATGGMAMPATGDTNGNASGAQAASSTDDSNLPTCSRTVTDKCKQGSGHGGGHHRATRHHKK